MAWTCEQIETRLSDYLDHLLAGSELREFEAHAGSCARCGALVGRVAHLVTQMHRFEPVESPPRLEYNILDKTLGPRTEKKAWLAWLRPVWQPRFAYGAVSVFITGIVLSQALGLRMPTKSDLMPANIYRAADRRAHLLYARGSKFVTDLRVVYEIQSRLRPEAEPQPTPEQQQPAPSQPPGHTNGPQPKSPRELNRATNRNLTILACALGAMPARSLQ